MLSFEDFIEQRDYTGALTLLTVRHQYITSPPHFHRPNFGGMYGRFQAKRAKKSNFHIFETTALIATKFCTVIETTT